MKKSTVLLNVILWVGSMGLFSCASTPQASQPDPKAMQKEICAQRADLTEVTGSLWLKVQSREAKGQFPAVVSATPKNLKLEVTNLVGGREAFIDVSGSNFTIEHQGVKTTGRNSWGGIPLQWAVPLFTGRIPCNPVTAASGAKVYWNAGDTEELVVQRIIPNMANDLETMTYRFQDWAGKPWVKYLRWEIKSGKKTQVVEFEFMDPDDKIGWAKRITAKSDRGEVQIRWKDWNLKSAVDAQTPADPAAPAVTQ